MNTVQVKCEKCNTIFDKPKNEYNRSIKKNRSFYCSRRCVGLNNVKNFGDTSNNKPPINPYKANPFKYYLRNCNKRNHDVDLDLEYLDMIWNKQQGICPYTQVNLILNSHSLRHRDSRYTASLDRIDSSKGYVKGNVQFVSTCINYMKNTLTDEQTKEFLQQISKNILNFR